MMDKRKFHNACRILLNIDKDELVEAGIINARSESGTCWRRFDEDPLMFIAKLSDADYDALWNLIEARQPSKYKETANA